MVDNYGYRLGNALEVSLPEPDSTPLVLYPERRELQHVTTELSIDILEFLRLSQCDLQRLIGSRNSGLGRVMADSQQWLYEAEFLVLARQCLRQLLNNPDATDLQVELQKAVSVKTQERWFVAWNAAYASQEFQTLFSTAVEPLPPNAAKAGELIEAITELARVQRRWFDHERLPQQDVELAYQVIGSVKYAGQLLRAMDVLINQLSVLTRMLEMRTHQEPFCRAGAHGLSTPPPEVKVLQTVFFKFYIGEIQPYIALVYQEAKALQLSLRKLLSVYEDSPEVMENPAWKMYWHQTWDEQSEVSVWNRYQVSVESHTKAWQGILNACGVMPR
ncbi:DUF3080 family protein [Marinibactrum halimedae]|uniref:DUF3080 family protein n=1 Tax=Marinibactrum halimedae TaxID=1444977 RepID=A0AA37TB96_9GAMM|nr:DUF3080 family protein [Marinibactrum halimedae]MCD9458951.1 DUF3080 domain-containing protein [Marinibactrum halimedae]GLS26920.1 hypothetical protein GCM10007877_26390 [Marinibactrum halimedae]